MIQIEELQFYVESNMAEAPAMPWVDLHVVVFSRDCQPFPTVGFIYQVIPTAAAFSPTTFDRGRTRSVQSKHYRR